MSTTNITPGWYPDPTGAPRQMYFDGESWIAAAAPPPAGAAAPVGSKTGISWVVVVVGVVGLIMAQQSTSLMNGTGNIWLGVVIAAAALAAAFFTGAADWARWIAGILLFLALGAALYMEHQMDEKRTEISDRLSHITDSTYRS